MSRRTACSKITTTNIDGGIIMRKMAAFLLSLVIVCTISAHSFAAESPYDENGSRVVYSWENPNWEEELYGDAGTDNMVQPRYGEREEITVVGTEEKMFFTDPEGQPEEGFRFSGSGGAIFINLGGGSPVEVSLSLGWGPISISVAPGEASKSSVGGILVNIPSDGYYHKVKLMYTCMFTRTRIDQYRGTEYLGTAYRTDYTVKKIDAIEYRVVW